MRAKTNEVVLEYETFGDRNHPPILLVTGVGLQLLAYPEPFCQALAAQGFYVVRLDNRDIGLSTKLDALGSPDILRALSGDPTASPYAIQDMADDVAGLIEALGLPKAHLVGLSMGGFIVQEAAIRHQERLLSLASIMSSTGDRRVGQPRPEVTPFLLAPPPHTREAALDRAATLWRAIGSPGFPFDEAKVRRDAGAAWDRNHEYAGVGRQLAAILTMRDRTADLARVSVPTVVIHGKDDPLVDVSGGEATAKAVPGARLVLVPGMGHDLPVGVWPVVLDALVANAKRADGEASH